jgi:acetate kinase
VILVLNCGSSSIKYRLFDSALVPITGGLIEHIGEPGGPEDHTEALRAATGALRLTSPALTAIGHRVIHGGADFVAPTLITDDVAAAIEKLTPLAPLHNPPALAGIAVARAARPDLPHVAIFDTAFHATLPPAAYTYAIDADIAASFGIRRYGFHGTSHAYVSRRTAQLLGRPLAETNTIVLHLGNGASACAVAGGRSVETSMGLTPLEGLVMGGRSGDLDPAVVFQLHHVGGMDLAEIDDLLNRRSGLRGLCGDNDMRQVEARRTAGDPDAALAFDVYCHRIRKYVGAYTATLRRVDAITFTGGVGENSAAIRGAALDGLESLGVRIDAALNQQPGADDRVISPNGGTVAVCVIPTAEELEIATQTARLTATTT